MKLVLIRMLVIAAGCLAGGAAGTAHVPEKRYGEPQRTIAHPAADGSASDSWCAAHMARGELVQALFDCDHAVAANPQNVDAFSNRGSLFLLTKDAAKALVDFEAALRLRPDDSTLYYNRGLAKARLGKRADAIADYSEAIRLRPDMAIAYHNRGYEHEIMGQRDQAIRDYRRALEIQPGLKPSAQALRRLLGKS